MALSKQVLALAGILGSIGPTGCAAGQRIDSTVFVRVDGVDLRVRLGTSGDRAQGPTVVFESGGATPLETWDPVLPAVAEFARTVAYDRPGTGASAWDGVAPTPERAVERLRRLLSELEIPPPYVLVGHSWGGALVRYFVGAHPDLVSAVLYVDPMDITQSPAEEAAVFDAVGAGEAGRAAFYRMQEQGLASARSRSAWRRRSFWTS